MIKFFRFIFLCLLSVILIVTVSAKETVIYENDFSNNNLSDFVLNGNWKVSNGVLETEKGTGSAYITYSIPKEYMGKDLRIEVDYLGFSSTGGITVGAAGDNLASSATDFFGYEGFIGSHGTKGAFGCYDKNGTWSGLVGVGQETIDVQDLHLVMEISGNSLLFRVMSLDGSTKYFGVEYTIGLSSLDVYNAFSGDFGLRKFRSVGGSFDNFKITAIEEDEMPTMGKILTLGGIAYKASKDLFVVSNTLRGSGAMLTYSDLPLNSRVNLTLEPTGVSKFFFGLDSLGNGYAFEIHKNNSTVSLYRLDKYDYSLIGTRSVPIGDTDYSVAIEICDGAASVTFDVFFDGEDALPSFDTPLDGSSRGFGFWLEGGKVKDIRITELESRASEETYTNALIRGADPDVLYYDGTYYLYNRINSGNDIFLVHTSPDLVHWTTRNVVFTIDDSYTATSYMSPNAFYYDGIFYLFYAALNSDGQQRVYYATSDSPYGPFTHKNGQVPVHEFAEIGGHPYLDESGKVYMTFVRFGSGNHIWIEEVKLNNGIVTPVSGTLTDVISPEFEYEIDGYGAIAEGGVIYKHNGYYYMIYASGHYLGKYGESYAVAKNILGPYTKYKNNEILSSTTLSNGVGDGILVPSPDGKELFMVYHRHYKSDSVEPRYTCIDRVKFVADPNGGCDILTVSGPTTTPQLLPSNIYRYDIDRDGETTLLDALKAFKHMVENAEYSGTYDANLNGGEDAGDVLLIIKDMLD